jgi:hypothetical protein
MNVVLNDPAIDKDDTHKDIYVMVEMIKRVQDLNAKVEESIYETVQEYQEISDSLSILMESRIDKDV